MNKRVILIIADGWGIAKNPEVSAVDQADTPFFDALIKQYPHSVLNTSGLSVGLPEGQAGNSEVGHLNIGAGRVVFQDIVRINKAIEDGSFYDNPVLTKTLEYAKQQDKALHLIGLVSDGGVHSHIDHIKALCKAAHSHGLKKVYIHAFTDGRDTDPKSGTEYLNELKEYCQRTTGQIASVIGRYYAMDRDRRWERTKLAYDLLINGTGTPTDDFVKTVSESYEAGITDEFIKPIVCINADGLPMGKIKPGDAVINFNFRTDRGRQITQVLTQHDFHEFSMQKLDLHYMTMTNYDSTYNNLEVLYEKDNLTDTLGEIISNTGKKQIRIAETEKYPHVTYFFSGGREKEFKGEKRILCPSPKVATYDLKPEMSAFEVKDAIIRELKKKEADFVCLNFANPDMVGHTGVFEAAVKACEVTDQCLDAVVNTALANGYTAVIIADHGNADKMRNPDGSVNTAHTVNPVPCILVDEELKATTINDGILADIAPTILKLIGIEKPNAMTGVSLL